MSIMARSRPDSCIAKILQEAAADDGRLISLVDDVLDYLKEDGHVFRSKIAPRFVGVSPANRDGYGISDAAVHELGAQIVSVGWSFSACQHACCIEDDPITKAASVFTHKLAANSEMLGVYQENDVRYGSLACSRTNQFLLAASQAAKSDVASISEGGRLSKEKICRGDINFQSAIEEGLNWTVLRYNVAHWYPELPLLIQRARNVNLCKPDNEVQLMLRIHCAAQAQSLAKHGCVDWASIVNNVRLKATGTIHDVEALALFCQRWSGGDMGVLLAELLQFHRNHVPANRVVPATTFIALSQLKLTERECCPFFIMAVVKAQFTAPPAKVQQQICKLFTPADISGMAKKLTVIVEAEKLLRACRGALDGRLSQKALVRIVGRLDCAVARHVLGKSGEFKSVTEIASRFVLEMQVHCGDHTIANPYESAAILASQGSGSGTPIGPNFVQFDNAGAVQNAVVLLLQQHGFHVNRSVALSDDASVYKITAIDDGGFVTMTAGTCQRVIHGDKLLEIGQISRSTTGEPTELLTWQRFDGAAQAKIGALHVAMHAYGSQLPQASLRVVVKPRGVFIADDAAVFKKHKVQILAASTKIGVAKLIHSAGTLIKDGIFVAPQIAPLKSDPGDPQPLIPAWYISTTNDIAAANVELRWVKFELDVLNLPKWATAFKQSAQVPVFVNIRDVQPGEELLQFVAAPELIKTEPKRKLREQPVASASKKVRSA
jgi:hypothetical protein